MNHFTMHRSVTARATRPRLVYAAPAAPPALCQTARRLTRPIQNHAKTFYCPLQFIKAPISCTAMVMSIYDLRFVSVLFIATKDVY